MGWFKQGCGMGLVGIKHRSSNRIIQSKFSRAELPRTPPSLSRNVRVCQEMSGARIIKMRKTKPPHAPWRSAPHRNRSLDSPLKNKPIQSQQKSPLAAQKPRMSRFVRAAPDQTKPTRRCRALSVAASARPPILTGQLDMRASTWSLILVLTCTTGCGVYRTITVKSDPPGALIYMNGLEIGRTPVTRDFVWYGRYEVEVRKDGYQTIKTASDVNPPWWQIIPFDFFAEL